MREKKSFSVRVEEFLAGKGFYIVLFACVAVIGVSAWLLLFSQYSPLDMGDEEDYLDVMGDVPAPDSNEPDTTGGNPADSPEHDVQKPSTVTIGPNEPDEDALTVKDDRPKDNAPKDDSPKGDTPKEDTPKDGEEPEAPADPEPEAPEAKPSDLSFLWPVNGEITAEHSPAALIFDKTMGDWRTHTGIDIAAPLGTKVLSCCSGTVTRVEEDDRYGTVVEIDHGAGVVSTYANLAGMPTVKVGDAVAVGSVIGSVGATSLYETDEDAHLHFTITVNGESADPLEYLPKK